MVSIASLLNPLTRANKDVPSSPCSDSDQLSSADLCSPTSDYSPETPPKKPKMTRDAAIFAKGKIKGEARYLPFENLDAQCCREIRRFEVYPFGRITEFPRHIPYNSDKKGFQEKTGRDSFEVFQYNFKVPGESKEYTVMWDYNVGLVRITSFFKCCKYSKTTPAKMLNSNVGLRDICYSVTGGALVAQGYWMHYEAAKAMAATFCYHIRYALVPIFGPDFARLCHDPDDPAFGHMIISRDIIKRCSAVAKELRTLGETRRSSRGLITPSSTDIASEADSASTQVTRKIGKMNLYPESGYGTDTDASDRTPLFPDAAAEAAWMAAERACVPRSERLWMHGPPTSAWLPPTPTTTTDMSKARRIKRSYAESDEDGNDESLSDGSSEVQQPKQKRKKSTTPTRETRAAYMLMQLSAADSTWMPTSHSKRRRASL